MQHVKRPVFLLLSIEDRKRFEISELLRGDLSLKADASVFALSVLTGSKQALSLQETLFLAKLPASSWTALASLSDEIDSRQVDVDQLIEKGLLLSDAEDPEMARRRRFDELLSTGSWHPVAASQHFMERDVESEAAMSRPLDVVALAQSAEKDAAEFVRRHGLPPPAFHRVDSAGSRIELALSEREGGLYDVLRARKTVRSFDPERPLALEDFEVLLRYVFGCHGYVRLDRDIVLLHKTSPSGGSLHPIEAYPLVLDVEGVASGLYHYGVRDHALELIEEIEPSRARRLAIEISHGQEYVGSAHALVLLTARFYRNQWKYRRRSRTYSVMLMDAGHLSQTFYLVATELGLGAFYTAAINGPLMEQTLGLEAPEEGALGICGCGVPAADDSGLGFQPFVPRQTDL